VIRVTTGRRLPASLTQSSNSRPAWFRFFADREKKQQSQNGRTRRGIDRLDNSRRSRSDRIPQDIAAIRSAIVLIPTQ
jgi:hypothetical protein